MDRYPSNMKRKPPCTVHSMQPRNMTPCADMGWARAEISCYHPPQSALCLWTLVSLFFVSCVHWRAVCSSCFAGRTVLSGHGAAVPCANINGIGNSSTQLEPRWAVDRDTMCVGECNLMLCLKERDFHIQWNRMKLYPVIKTFSTKT